MHQNPTQQIFGKHLLKEFFLDESFLNINFGSYGSPPRCVVDKQRQYQEIMDRNTEKWFRYEIFPRLIELRGLIASYVKTSPENVVLIENASDGANAILRSILTKPKEKVLVFDLTYPMVRNTLSYLKDMFEIEIITVVLIREVLNSDEKILAIAEDTIEKNGGKIKLAIYDHISSQPSLIFPVNALTQLFKKHGILTLVDGAHTVGQIPVDLNDIGPDFYFSNFHKWAFAPKCAAFLYVDKKYQDIIHPNIIGNKYKAGFIEEFSNTGTRDISAWLSIKDALEFRNKFNDDLIMEYNRELAWKVGMEVAKVWGTEVLIEKKERVGSMVNVRVPCEDKQIIETAIQKTLLEMNSFVVATALNDGKFYARFSSQIFNEIEDFVRVAEFFLKALRK